MPTAQLGDLEIAYEVVGEGQPWVITPGGRYNKESGGVGEMAQALADHGKQAIIWDRPNCGASSVAFRGRSESEVQADALGALLRHLDVGPTVIIGGSGGARVSLLTAARNPDISAGLAMWWISGGVYGLHVLAQYYCAPSVGAAWHGGMEAVLELPAWHEVLERNPQNRDRFLSMDRLAFVEVMERWMMAYYPCDDSKLVPGLDDEDVARLSLPILIFRSGSTDINHTRATSERLAANLPGAQLVEPPWGDNEWNERSADQAAPRFARWPLLVPQLIEWSNERIKLGHAQGS
jgi:pimeloyl-ACP methyl ester carboxylesterase